MGFDDPAQYCENALHPYFGALIGRIANRIPNGTFVLGNSTYHTPINEPSPTGGNDTLHGGAVGFDRRVWTVEKTSTHSAKLRLKSADGDQGFPGMMHIEVTYTLDDTTWWIDYSATSEMDTVVSLTQHTYWNLNGCQDSVLEHVIWMPQANSFVQVDKFLLPTGVFQSVDDVPAMDFRMPRTVGSCIENATAAADSGGGKTNE